MLDRLLKFWSWMHYKNMHLKQQPYTMQINPLKTYPVLVNDIYNRHQFPLMRSECNEGNAANFDEALEYLNRYIEENRL